LFFVKKKRKK
jgi:uncharacterized protein (DUF2062 family)